MEDQICILIKVVDGIQKVIHTEPSTLIPFARFFPFI